MGDFHIHWNKSDNDDSKKFANLLQHVSKATHVSGIILDWAITHEENEMSFGLACIRLLRQMSPLMCR